MQNLFQLIFYCSYFGGAAKDRRWLQGGRLWRGWICGLDCARTSGRQKSNGFIISSTGNLVLLLYKSSLKLNLGRD